MISIEVQEPWFSEIKNKSKTVEGRLAKGKFLDLKIGDVFRVINGEDVIILLINRIKIYGSFREMLLEEELNKVLPGISTLEKGIEIYRQFYTEKEENFYGVFAFEICLYS